MLGVATASAVIVMGCAPRRSGNGPRRPMGRDDRTDPTIRDGRPPLQEPSAVYRRRMAARTDRLDADVLAGCAAHLDVELEVIAVALERVEQLAEPRTYSGR